jgi:carboxymethylenebutenolidase
MIEQTVEIPTPAGAMATFIAHPEREGPHPVVVILMDAPGVRETLRDMARRLATVGYYVMLPNLYYRRGLSELSNLTALPQERARAKLIDLAASLTTANVMEDTDALLAFADLDPGASPGRAGCVGYGTSGQFAVSFAARHPERVGAAASICGIRLVTDQDDSPHLALQRATAEFYFACAADDSWAPLAMVEALDQAAKAYGPPTEVEIYEGVKHGFAVLQRPVYDKAAAERHWERLLALFRRRLQAPEPAVLLAEA